MTPTFLGRIQTRTFLLLTLGMVITLIYGLIGGLMTGSAAGFLIPFAILFFVLIVGFIWDAIYILLQRLRWDRDWPIAFQFATGFVEMIPALILFLVLVNFTGRITLPLVILFLFHYWSVWWMVYISGQGLMRIIFHRWRFRGGQLV